MCFSIHCDHGFTSRGALTAAAGFSVFAGLDSANIGAANAKEAGASQHIGIFPPDARRGPACNFRSPQSSAAPTPAWRLNLRSTKDPAIFLLSGSPAISPMTTGSPVSNMR
jgi:hypothetical protein